MSGESVDRPVEKERVTVEQERVVNSGNVDLRNRKAETTTTTTHTQPQKRAQTGKFSEEDKERLKQKGGQGLLTIAGVIGLITLIALASGYYFMSKAKHGVERGLMHGLQNWMEGKDSNIFGSSNQHGNSHDDDDTSDDLLQKITDLVGLDKVDKGKKIGKDTVEKLREILSSGSTSGHGHHGHDGQSVGDKVKATSDETLNKLSDLLTTHKGRKLTKDTVNKIRDILGLKQSSHSSHSSRSSKKTYSPSTTQKIKELLGTDKNKAIGQDTLVSLKQLLGVDPDKMIGEESLDSLKDTLGYEPTMWQSIKRQLAQLQDPADNTQRVPGGKTIGLGKSKNVEEAQRKQEEAIRKAQQGH